MTTKSNDSASRLTAREYAALHTKVPQSGNEWLDSMIQAARDLDAEQFEAKLEEPRGSVAYPDVSNPTTHTPQGHVPYDQAAGRVERPEIEPAKTPKPVSKKPKAPKKEPELRDQKD